MTAPAIPNSYLDLHWQDEALCRGANPDDFFPEEFERGSLEFIERATYATFICRSCPVQAECLNWAIKLGNIQGGVAGGTTRGSRRNSRLGKRAT